MGSDEHEATAAGGQEGGAWLLLHSQGVPERWAERARQVILVPLLPQEAAQVLGDVPATPALSPDETRLLRELADGKTARVIARELGVSQRAVERRVAALRERFGAGSTVELVAMGARHVP